MLEDITYEKVEEVIALATEAMREPEDRTASHRHPITHEPPLRPQPAGDWEAAFRRYLTALPARAVAELEALYRLGTGEFDRVEDAVTMVCGRDVAETDRVAFLSSRADLPQSLRAALEKW